ncbi:Uma2 family endonuclease [Pendulispora rubella]|uniref:Uma2 family endonuclease n=1 Tax=Pendulispora rubella TaxID=2741070 RepID=A0ABZ2KXV4_9BACT
MGATAPRRYKFEDYLLVEEMSPNVKHEFFDGTIYAMAGGSPDHAAMAMSVGALLIAQLGDKPCGVYSSDLRIRVPATGLGTYPDVSVICGKIELDPEDPKKHTATNPTLLVEILSPTTEEYDRTDKLAQYEQIESLQEVVFVAHDTRCIEVVRRMDDSWKHFEYTEGEAELSSIQCKLPLARVYRDPLATA